LVRKCGLNWTNSGHTKILGSIKLSTFLKGEILFGQSNEYHISAKSPFYVIGFRFSYGDAFKADSCPLNIDRYLADLTNHEEFKAQNRKQFISETTTSFILFQRQFIKRVMTALFVLITFHYVSTTEC